MLKQLPFKKDYLLTAGTVILLFLGYQLAFKKTITAWQLNRSLKQQLAQSTDVSSEPQYQERKNANLERTIDLFKADTLEFRGNIISEITRIAEKEQVKLSDVPSRDPLLHSSQFMIQRLDLEGDYFHLTKVFNLLKQARGIGMIRAATYKTPSRESEGKAGAKLNLEIYLIILNK